jgi:outer membrane immunogenic protein
VASPSQHLEAFKAIMHVGLGNRQGVIMKKLLLGSLVALTMGGSAAIAADMPLKAPPPVAVFSWTGCYVGIEGGGAWGRSKHRAPNFSAPGNIGGTDITNWFDVSGGVAGVEYGCNQQFGGNWVFGIEGDWSWSSKKGGANELPVGNPLFFDSTKEKWVSTSRARVGYAWDRAWLYVTGGFAAARVEMTLDGTGAGVLPAGALNFVSDRKTVYGYVVGVGLEYAFLNNWSLKAEYLYMNFGENGFLNPAPAFYAPRSFQLDDHIVRVGLNWKFTDCAFGSCGGPAPAPIYTK